MICETRLYLLFSVFFVACAASQTFEGHMEVLTIVLTNGDADIGILTSASGEKIVIDSPPQSNTELGIAWDTLTPGSKVRVVVDGPGVTSTSELIGSQSLHYTLLSIVQIEWQVKDGNSKTVGTEREKRIKAITSGQHNVALIRVTSYLDDADPSGFCDDTCANNLMWLDPGNNVAYEYAEASYGQLQMPQGPVFNVAVLKNKADYTYPQDFTIMANDPIDAVETTIPDVRTTYDTFMSFADIIPTPGVLGVAALGAGYGILESNAAFVAVHEIGHTLNMRHASIDFGDDNFHDEEVTSEEYGDHSCQMGNGAFLSNFNAPHRVQMGWLAESQIKDIGACITTGDTFYLPPLQSSGPGVEEEVVLRIPRSLGGHYFIARRDDTGLEANMGAPSNTAFYVNKFHLHYQMVPTGNTRLIATLGVGDTYTSIDSTLDIEVTSETNIKIKTACMPSASPVPSVSNVPGVGCGTHSVTTQTSPDLMSVSNPGLPKGILYFEFSTDQPSFIADAVAPNVNGNYLFYLFPSTKEVPVTSFTDLMAGSGIGNPLTYPNLPAGQYLLVLISGVDTTFDIEISGSCISPEPFILWDAETNATFTGIWNVGTSLPHFGSSYYFTNDPGATATFSHTLVAAGLYRLGVSWVAASNRDSFASLSVVTPAGTENYVINQKQSGNQDVFIGDFDLTGTVQVIISKFPSDDMGEYVSIDQVTLTLLSAVGNVPGPHPGNDQATLTVDNDESDLVAISGPWAISTLLPHYGEDYLWVDASNGGSVTLKKLLPTTAMYDVYASHQSSETRSVSVPYTVKHAGGQTTVNVNQQIDGYSEWVHLGRFSFDEHVDAEVVIDASASSPGIVCADAVYFRLGADPSPSPSPVPASGAITLDNMDASTTGTWLSGSSLPHYADDYLWATGPANTATFTFTVAAPGFYELFESHTAHSNRGTVTLIVTDEDATYNIAVDQTMHGNTFRSLGVFSFSAGTAYSLLLSTASLNAGEFAAVDAIQIAPLSEADPVYIDSEDTAHVTISGDWGCSFDVVPFQGTCAHWIDGTGSEFVRFHPLIVLPVGAPPQSREVFVWYTSHPSRSTAVEIRIQQDGSADAVVNVDQTTGGSQWVSLGVYAFARGNSQAVTVLASATGITSIDAIKIEPPIRK